MNSFEKHRKEVEHGARKLAHALEDAHRDGYSFSGYGTKVTAHRRCGAEHTGRNRSDDPDGLIFSPHH